MSKIVKTMIASILKEKREVLGLKIQEISTKTGIDQALLSKYESGKSCYQHHSYWNHNQLNPSQVFCTFHKLNFFELLDLIDHIFVFPK